MSLCYWPLVSTSSRVAFGYVASTLRLYPALLGQAPLISGDRMACYTLPPTTKHAPGRTRVPSQLLSSYRIEIINHASHGRRVDGDGWERTSHDHATVLRADQDHGGVTPPKPGGAASSAVQR